MEWKGKEQFNNQPLSLQQRKVNFSSFEWNEKEDIITVIRLILFITKTIALFLFENGELLNGINEINLPSLIQLSLFHFNQFFENGLIDEIKEELWAGGPKRMNEWS